MFKFYLLQLITIVVSSTKCTLNIFENTTEVGELYEVPRSRLYISDQEIENAFLSKRNVVADRETLEIQLVQEGRIVDPRQRQPDLSLIQKTSAGPRFHQMEKDQLLFSAVTEEFIGRKNLSPQQVQEDLPELSFKGPFCSRVWNNCMQDIPTPRCDRNYRYRTADGTCNNLQFPTWGAANTCFRRLLPAYYVGQSGFRESVYGGRLPEPRDLSLNVHSHLNRPTNFVTHMYMFFGQLLDHDLTQAPISVTVNNLPIQCCPATDDQHPQCAPINIRANDYFYSQFGTRCMNFVRSTICPTCALGFRQQMNRITAYIDASFVYGNSLNETFGLRTNDGTGRLRVERSPVGDLLPPSPNPANDLCSFLNTSDICFLAGDNRANQHTTLASLHTIFLREHNRLADGLKRINPYWNGERIFQEARRILGAQMQAITYKEWLPSTLGPDRMSFFKLGISKRGSKLYDPNIDATLYNEFSAAAFRFGHSLVNGIVTQYPRTNGNQLRLLRNEFFQPFELRSGLIGPLLRGASYSSAQWFDRHLVPDVTNYLYRIRGNPSGLDLASINIQRGRDHGLQPYTRLVQECSDNKYIVRQFSDLVNLKLMSQENAQLLQQNYRHVNDIDLWTGILSEYPKENAVLGPTGACIVGLQFNTLIYGDRFYFEHTNQVGSFTYQQMEELRKATLSKIICDNSDVNQITENSMLFQSWRNPTMYCSNIPGIDLSYWKEW